MANIGLNTGFVNTKTLQHNGELKKINENDNRVANNTHYGSKTEFDNAREAGKIASGDTFVDNGRVWEVGVVIDGGRGGYSAGTSKFA